VGINHKTLVENYRKDATSADAGLRDAFKQKQVRAREFDLGRLFVECFGWHEFSTCREDRQRLVNQQVAEAAGSVSTNAFANITGQIVYNALMEGYEAPEYVFKALIPEVMTSFLNGEKVAGIKGLGDETQVVGENEPYPLVGTSEDYIETPMLQKRGFIVPVTREAIFSDRTGVLLERCGKVGEAMGYNDENRAIDCIIDENGGATSAKNGGHRYHWRGDSIATYGDSSGTHNWDNKAATNALVDYSDVENAELLLDAMLDPGTGQVTGKYRVAASDIIIPSSLIHTAKQIFTATRIGVHVGGYATSGNLAERDSPNSLGSYRIVTSPMLAARLATDTHWFLGNVAKAFRKMVAWKNEVTNAPAGSHEEFTRDIVFQTKGSQMDAYTTFDPRYMVQNTVA
jgi:hypothetical protein